MGERGERFSGTSVKDTWTKPRGNGSKGGTQGWLGLRGVVGRYMQTTVIEQQ